MISLLAVVGLIEICHADGATLGMTQKESAVHHQIAADGHEDKADTTMYAELDPKGATKLADMDRPHEQSASSRHNVMRRELSDMADLPHHQVHEQHGSSKESKKLEPHHHQMHEQHRSSKESKTLESKDSVLMQSLGEHAEHAATHTYVNLYSDGPSVSVDKDGTIEQLGRLPIGSTRTFTGPGFVVGEEVKGGGIAEWASFALKGKKFVHRPYRSSPQTYFLYALDQAATVTITVNHADTSSISLGANERHLFEGDYTDKTLRFDSDQDILISVRADVHDNMPIPPASTTVYGSCSTQCALTVFKGTGTVITETCSDGSTRTVLEDDWTAASSDTQYTGKACKWTASAGSGADSDLNLIGGASFADGDGGDGTTFLPKSLFQLKTIIPFNMEYLKIVSDEAAICIPTFATAATTGAKSTTGAPITLTGSDGVFTYRTDVFHTTEQLASVCVDDAGCTQSITAGDMLTCNHKVMVWGDDNWDDGGDSDELQLIQVFDSAEAETNYGDGTGTLSSADSADDTLNRTSLESKAARPRSLVMLLLAASALLRYVSA